LNKATDSLSTIFHRRLIEIEMVAFDFDGVFTDNSVYVSQDGLESVRCWRGDGLGLSKLASIGVRTTIISTEVNAVVSARAQKLNIPYIQAVHDKGLAILELCRSNGVSPRNTMFVGNDINDIAAFEVVGFPVGVADADLEIFPYISYRTIKKGGFGAVREICDLIYRVKQNANML
jgi:3-deoxy-D-manno-octulosonate 8-phosphate phosphatase (KDO 8-P phosphatase)